MKQQDSTLAPATDAGGMMAFDNVSLFEAPEPTIGEGGGGVPASEGSDTGVEGGAAAPPEGQAAPPAPAKEDPSRLEYWQSRADKAKRENEQMRALLANPKVQKAITDAITGEPAPAPAREPELVPPVRPVKPSGFDEVAALNDPASPSFKYREEQLRYNEQLTEYLEKREQQRAEREQAHAQRIQQEEAQRAQMGRVRVELQARGIAGAEADDFIQFASDPSQVSIDNLVAVWRQARGKVSTDPKQQRKAEEILRQQARRSVPAPLGTEAGGEGGGASEDEEDPTGGVSFNKGLIARAKRR